MELVQTDGIVIAVHKKDDVHYASIDVLSSEYGILRWYNDRVLDPAVEYMLSEIYVSGKRSTVTACNLITCKIVNHSFDNLTKNGSLSHALAFVQLLRAIVFDGIPLEGLYKITKQTIKNFAAGFTPDIVLIKALYLVCREEGYAVDNIWLNSLTKDEQALAKQMIYCKSDMASPPEAGDILRSLQNWILSF